MSSLSSIIDALRSTIPTYSGFDSKKEILNAYSIEDNPSKFLEDAWGLVVGTGVRAVSDDPVIHNYVTTVRAIGVVLCRPVYDVHGIGLQVSEQVKALYDDAIIIRDNFLDLGKFGVLKNGESIGYEGDTGVNFLASDDGFKYVYTQVDFNFEIIETINRS